MRCPSDWTHEDVARVISDIFQRPLHAKHSASWGTTLQLVSFVVFRERHAPREGETVGPYHWHIAVKCTGSFRFAPYKRALTVNHSVASHWSCSHTGYWSAVRYGYMPFPPRKHHKDLDPKPFVWSRDGLHPSLFDVSQEPTTAAALSRRREHKVLAAQDEGKPEPRPSEMEL